MSCVLVTVSRGIIDEVTFYHDELTAIQALSKYVKDMDPEHYDAAVYSRKEMIANAKTFLDENDQYIEQNIEHIFISNREETICIIGNPNHTLGFMMASPDDPLGYKESVLALSDLGQMRKDHGTHLMLYRLIPVTDLKINRADLERHNEDCGIEDFEYRLVKEYLEERDD